MLKFLEGREQQFHHINRNDNMRRSSNSFLPNNRQFTSPLHQENILKNDKPSDYIYKRLPPIETYNPVSQVSRSVERPEYIIKQKDVYTPKYQSEMLQKGFKKKSGIFQSFQHLLNKNKVLIDNVHPEKANLKLPSLRTRQNKSTQQPTLPTIQETLTSRNTRHTRQSKLNESRIERSRIISNIPDTSMRKGNQSRNFSSKQTLKRFEEKYQQDRVDAEEKERQMHQLSIFDKKIQQMREEQQLKKKKLI